MATLLRWAASALTPSRKTASPPPAVTTPPPATISRISEQQHHPLDSPPRPVPRSLFSNAPSSHQPGAKRSVPLDFDAPWTAKKTRLQTPSDNLQPDLESPLTTKKTSLEATSSTPRKRKPEFDEFKTPQKKVKTHEQSQTMPQIRSALKPRSKVRTPATGLKKARFNADPLTSSKSVWGTYGRAGTYTGSVFDYDEKNSFASPEASPTTPSTISDTSSSMSLSPTTKANTVANTPRGRMDPTVEDLDEDDFVPTPHHPRPGQFCLPDELSYLDGDDDESAIDQDITPTSANLGATTPATPGTIRRGFNAVFPDSPETPRPSHAQLPLSAPSSTPAITSTYPTPPEYSYSTPPMPENIFAEAGSDAINKARAAAEKYKPESVGKQASKLSQVTQARSRSPSPPASTPATPGLAIDSALITHDKENMVQGQHNNSAGAGDNTSHEYEQEYDDWARNLDWPEPGQKIVEEEHFKSDMMGLIMNDWTEEDDEQSEHFWHRQFDRVVDAGRRADREGKVLMFV